MGVFHYLLIIGIIISICISCYIYFFKSREGLGYAEGDAHDAQTDFTSWNGGYPNYTVGGGLTYEEGTEYTTTAGVTYKSIRFTAGSGTITFDKVDKFDTHV